jgi:DNA-binding NarL/FixJ family response regulator
MLIQDNGILEVKKLTVRNDQIAKKLIITEGTVKLHVHRIIQRFGCGYRTHVCNCTSKWNGELKNIRLNGY